MNNLIQDNTTTKQRIGEKNVIFKKISRYALISSILICGIIGYATDSIVYATYQMNHAKVFQPVHSKHLN